MYKHIFNNTLFFIVNYLMKFKDIALKIETIYLFDNNHVTLK
jgi:hypothetical protein